MGLCALVTLHRKTETVTSTSTEIDRQTDGRRGQASESENKIKRETIQSISVD